MKIITLLIVATITLLIFLSWIERIYWPKVSLSPIQALTTVSKDEFLKLRSKCGSPLEVSQNTREKIYIRCGIFWPFTTVYSVDIKNAPWSASYHLVPN
jgi:hypothetical protein